MLFWQGHTPWVICPLRDVSRVPSCLPEIWPWVSPGFQPSSQARALHDRFNLLLPSWPSVQIQLDCHWTWVSHFDGRWRILGHYTQGKRASDSFVLATLAQKWPTTSTYSLLARTSHIASPSCKGAGSAILHVPGRGKAGKIWPAMWLHSPYEPISWSSSRSQPKSCPLLFDYSLLSYPLGLHSRARCLTHPSTTLTRPSLPLFPSPPSSHLVFQQQVPACCNSCLLSCSLPSLLLWGSVASCSLTTRISWRKGVKYIALWLFRMISVFVNLQSKHLTTATILPRKFSFLCELRSACGPLGNFPHGMWKPS